MLGFACGPWRTSYGTCSASDNKFVTARRARYTAPRSTRARQCGQPLKCQTSYAEGGASSRTALDDAPRSAAEVLRTICTGIGSAVANGSNRIQITALLPGLNPKVEDTFPYNEELLFSVAASVASCDAWKDRSVAMLFFSEGTAASAAQFYRKTGTELYEGTTFGAALDANVKSDENGGDDMVYVIVQPRNLRGSSAVLDIERMVKKAPKATFVLFNPLLEDTEDNLATSIIEIDRRRNFVRSFAEVYHLRPLYYVQRPSLIAEEVGMLVMRYGGEWKLFSGRGDDISLAKTYSKRPSRSEIDNAIAAEDARKRRERSPSGSKFGAKEAYILGGLGAVGTLILVVAAAFGRVN